MISRVEMIRNFDAEVFDGCDHVWMPGMGELQLAGELVPWLRGACKERGIRVTGKPRRDLVESLLEWEQRRTAQVMLWGNQRYCQRSGIHMRHIHEAFSFWQGISIDRSYWCDGRPVAELTV